MDQLVMAIDEKMSLLPNKLTMTGITMKKIYVICNLIE